MGPDPEPPRILDTLHEEAPVSVLVSFTLVQHRPPGAPPLIPAQVRTPTTHYVPPSEQLESVLGAHPSRVRISYPPPLLSPGNTSKGPTARGGALRRARSQFWSRLLFARGQKLFAHSVRGAHAEGQRRHHPPRRVRSSQKEERSPPTTLSCKPPAVNSPKRPPNVVTPHSEIPLHIDVHPSTPTLPGRANPSALRLPLPLSTTADNGELQTEEVTGAVWPTMESLADEQLKRRVARALDQRGAAAPEHGYDGPGAQSVTTLLLLARVLFGIAGRVLGSRRFHRPRAGPLALRAHLRRCLAPLEELNPFVVRDVHRLGQHRGERGHVGVVDVGVEKPLDVVLRRYEVDRRAPISVPCGRCSDVSHSVYRNVMTDLTLPEECVRLGRDDADP